MSVKYVLSALLMGMWLAPAAPAAAAETAATPKAQQLEDARRRMEAAAREIAQLGAALGEGAIEFVQDIRLPGKRAMLGINIDGEGEEAARGVRILGVTPGGPAEKAGMRAGDVILSIDGQRLDTDSEPGGAKRLVQHLEQVEPGAEVTLEYERDGRSRSVPVVTEDLVRQRFAFAFGDKDFEFQLPGIDQLNLLEKLHSRWGEMELAPLSPALGEYFGTDVGLLVVRAPQDEDIDLRDGDVILRIDGRTPASPTHAMRILRSYATGERLVLEIVRRQQRMNVEVELKESEPALRRSRMPVPALRALPRTRT